MKTFITALALALLSIHSWGSNLDELQIEVDNDAIIQLEKTLASFDDSSPAKANIYIRIGDLYAEKGRRLFEQEIETKKKQGSAQARQSSIRSFLNALKLIKNEEEIANIKMRVATIYTEIDDTKKALALISEVIDNPKTPNSIRQSAYYHRGHGYFTTGEYTKALMDYNKVTLKDMSRDDQIYILYRKGWSHSQIDQPNEAKAAFKQALALVTASENRIGQDIYIDYASLILKENTTTVGEIKSLINNSRKEYQLTLMIEIAGEAYRLGRMDIAKSLYTEIANHPESSVVNQSIAKLRLLIINGNDNIKQKEQAMKELMLVAKRCSDTADCILIKKEIRFYVLQTHRLKKTKPDQLVLSTYKSYLAVFKDETSLFVAAAEVANFLDQHEDSASLYEEAISLEKDLKIKEQYLKSNLARAEASEIPSQKTKAFLLYLKEGQNQQTKSEIIFELAKTEYQIKNYLKSFEYADRLAQDSKTNLELRTKASLLAIDSLLKTQDHTKIAATASLYAILFKSQSDKFSEIANKAELSILVQESQNAKNQSSSKSRSQIQSLKKIYHKSTNLSEKSNLVKNMIRISQDSGLIEAHREALFLLIALPSVSTSEKKAAVLELYNLHLNQIEFSKALELTNLYPQFIILTPFEKAQLADMAQNKTIMLQSYKQTLKAKNSKNNQKAFAASRLVIQANDPIREFKNLTNYLNLDKGLKDQTQLLITLKTLKTDWLKGHKLSTRTKLLLNRINNFDKLLTKAKLKNQPKLTHNPKSLVARQERLNQLDAELLNSSQQKDLLAQTLWLIAIQNENLIFVTELSQLSLPTGIKKDQVEDYKNQLKQLSKPYLEKSIMAKDKLDKINDTLLAFMIQERQTLGLDAQEFFNKEILVLKSITQSHGYRWSTSSVEQTWLARLNEWKSLKRKNELNDLLNVKFISLETQFGNPVLVSFLKERRGPNE